MEIVYRNVRFNEKVDRCLRRRWKRHGDLSIRVREALDKVNLHDVELLDVDCSRVHAMQIGVFNSMWIAVHGVAQLRGCSVNTLVNSAVWAAFGARHSSLRGRPRGRNLPEVPVSEAFWESANMATSEYLDKAGPES
jgi:hypothetical protein